MCFGLLNNGSVAPRNKGVTTLSNKGHTATPAEPGRRRGSPRRRAGDARQFMVNVRRARLATLIQYEGLGRGQQARLARALGVSTTTISRDIAALFALVAPCPYCGSYPLLAGPLLDRDLTVAGDR